MGGKNFRSRLPWRTEVRSDKRFEQAASRGLLVATERPFQLSLQVLHQLKEPFCW